VLFVKCDNASPDVYRAYVELVPTERTDLDEVDGWIHLVNICEAHARSTVIVSSAARNNVAVRRYGQLFDNSLEALGADFKSGGSSMASATVLSSCESFGSDAAGARAHVIRNGYFSAEHKFARGAAALAHRRAQAGCAATYVNAAAGIRAAPFGSCASMTMLPWEEQVGVDSEGRATTAHQTCHRGHG
jgi:hypothetical protein